MFDVHEIAAPVVLISLTLTPPLSIVGADKSLPPTPSGLSNLVGVDRKEMFPFVSCIDISYEYVELGSRPAVSTT